MSFVHFMLFMFRLSRDRLSTEALFTGSPLPPIHRIIASRSAETIEQSVPPGGPKVLLAAAT
jgi:hypothetical protein